MECSVCLSTLDKPVSIPCGHVYCMKCLSQHVNAAENDDLTSTCPTCREEFNIVTPDLTYLPKKYHRYVLPGVRRIYVDTKAISELRKKLAQAEKKNKRLADENEALMQQCEKCIDKATAHAEREANAIDDLNEVKDDLVRVECDYEREHDLRRRYEDEVEDFRAECRDLREQVEDFKRRIQELESQASSASRDPGNSLRRSASVLSGNDDPSWSLDNPPDPALYQAPPRRRVVRPLPARKKVAQHLRDACDAADAQITKGNSRTVKKPRLSAPA